MEKIPEWVVKEVTPNRDYTLSVIFADGSKKRVDMRSVIEDGGVFKKLEDMTVFLRAHVAGDSVEWTSDLDIAPEFLYENGVDE